MTTPKTTTHTTWRTTWRAVSVGLAIAIALFTLVTSSGSREAEAQSTSLLTSAQPTTAAADDSGSVTVGVKFTVRRDGTLTAVRFFKGAGNTGTHVGGVFDADGRLLARASFSGETATGWQTARLSQPLAVDAGDTFTAGVLMPDGHYAVDQRFDWPDPSNELQAVGGTYRYGDSLVFPDRSYLGSNYWVDVSFTATSTAPAPAATSTSPAAAPTTAAPQPSASTTAPSSSTPASCPGSPNTPGGEDPWGGCWPGPHNTGYPHGLPGDTRTPVTLTAYTGPTTIKQCGVVIDSKIVPSDLVLAAGNGQHSASKPCLTVKNSLVKGVIHTDSAAFGPLVVTDTEIAPQGDVGWWENLGRYNTFAWRVDSHGSEGVIKCADYCEAHDSYVHDMALGGAYHYNAFGSNGMEASDGFFVIDHNWASCGDWARVADSMSDDAGCSADIGFYGDFDQIRNITLSRNFLAGMQIDPAVPGAKDRQPGYCLNPGYYPGKPYPRPTNVKVADNVFGRGSSGKCGVFGPTNSLNAQGDTAGNTWQGNRYADGTAISRPEE